MNEEERSGRLGQLASDYHFCYTFYVSPCSTEIAERSSGAGRIRRNLLTSRLFFPAEFLKPRIVPERIEHGVPDGGSTVSLLGFGLLGLAALRRK
jgi:hypothetical protein